MEFKSSDFIKAVKAIYEKIPEESRQREYLKLYSNIGKRYSFSINESKENWANNYTDNKFEPRINLIERLPNVLTIEFDTPGEKGLKPEEAQEQCEKELKKKGISYIKTTHKGKCDYLWIEFTKPISDEDAKIFLSWICPKGARVDLNFASSIKVFPVIFAPHRKYPNKEEIVYFSEGDKVIFSKLKIPKEIKIQVVKEKLRDGFVYETAQSKAGGDKIREIKFDYGKPKIELPGSDRLDTKFIKEITPIISSKLELFFRNDTRDVVEIGKIITSDKKTKYTGFVEIKPTRFITHLEKYIIPGYIIRRKDGSIKEFREHSVNGGLASVALQSQIFQEALPRIARIFTIPIPIIHNNELTFPKKGYDERFDSWLPHDAPEISNPNIPLDKAREILAGLYKEFCFQDKQDYVNAIAGLLTPFLRGIYPEFNTRTPVFFYLANRERAGKDYCAGITGILYDGVAMEEPAISTSEKSQNNNSEELRKKITAALLVGRKRLHFSNNKGYIDNATFEGVITNKKYSDRVLGRNEMVSFPNELDFSLSGNVGVGFTPDLANRCRFIRLFLDIEDANARRFENPNLHLWVRENRGIILSALYALIRNWIEKGKPKGTLPFASFPEWAEVCGGIIESAGYDSPCNQDKEVLALGGDSETKDMKVLFELCYKLKPEQWLSKQEIKQIIETDGEVFGYLDFREKADQTKFGNKLTKFVGRVLSDIRLIVRDNSVRSSRQELKFTKEIRAPGKMTLFGNVGNAGNLSIYDKKLEIDNNNLEKNNMVILDTKDTNVAKLEVSDVTTMHI